MDYLNKSLSSSFKVLRPYPSTFNPDLISTNPEFIYKNYSERDTFTVSNKLLSPEEWDAIANMLTKSTNFHTICLSGINIESYGLTKLGEILSANTSIKTLKLEWNYLNEYTEQFDFLCEVIARGNSIIYLHLNNNKLSSLQATSLCKIIRSNQVILQIDLRWNEIGNDGIREIISSLSSNNTIQELTLTGNKISPETLFELNEKLARNKNFFYNVNFTKENTKISKLPEYINEKTQLNTTRSQFYSPYMQFFREKDDEGKYMVEKEKEMTNEYKARYDSQLLNNANLEKKTKELEMLLNNEKTRNDDLKIQITKELQNEKDKILKYEEEILKSKEEFLKKEMEWRRLLSESEGDVSKLLQEKNEYLIEINLLKEQLTRQKDSYDEKYRLLEEHAEENSNHLNFNYSELKNENERIRKEYDDLIRSNNKDWERKFKNLEEQVRILKVLKEETEKENSNLKKELTEFKLNKEIECGERESRIIEEENRKLDNLIKQYDSKFRAFEFFKDDLNNKNIKLLEEIETLRKNLTDESSNYERTTAQLSHEKNNLLKTNNILTQTVNKQNAEISGKEGLINKLKNEINEIQITLREHLNSNKNKIEDLVNEYMKDKQNWEKERQELLMKCQNLESICEEQKVKLEKKEIDKYNLLEALKSQMAKHIDDKFQEKHKI